MIQANAQTATEIRVLNPALEHVGGVIGGPQPIS